MKTDKELRKFLGGAYSTQKCRERTLSSLDSMRQQFWPFYKKVLFCNTDLICCVRTYEYKHSKLEYRLKQENSKDTLAKDHRLSSYCFP